MAQLEPGTRLAERYAIVDTLGAGGMGVVYRARDEKLGRLVALKTLNAERVGDATACARLMREARAVAALEHANIAKVFDVGEMEDGGAFVVMELVRGRLLRDLMRSGELGRSATLSVLQDTAAALDHAHASGVVHRDVKPDNIMVREDGHAALLDFGLAKDFGPGVADTVSPEGATQEHLTGAGSMLGTLHYLAPEQARGEEVGPAADQFALGAMAYEALTGQLPWDGENAPSVLSKLLLDEPRPPSEVAPALPTPVDAVIARAIHKDPSQRWPSAGAFAEALLEAARGVMTVPPGPPPTSYAPLIAGGLIAVVGLAVAVPLLLRDRPAEDAGWTLPEGGAVACAILEADGVQAPSGWLGAMGADLACRRLTWRLGADPARTAVPAELLDLPREASDELPADPFAAPEARARSLAAARRHAAWIDGSVRREGDGSMHVELVLMSPEGERARASGESHALYEAVAVALDGVAEALPVTAQIDPELAPFVGTASVEGIVRFEELADAALSGVGVPERCAALEALGAEVHYFAGEVSRICARWGVRTSLTTPPLEREPPSALALTAPGHALEMTAEEVRALAETLEQARRDAETPYARAVIARGAVALRERLDEREAARDLLIASTPDLPRDAFLRVHLVRAMLRTPGATAATRAYAIWHPGTPDAWRTLALPIMSEPEAALPLLERAYLSGGDLPLYGTFYAHALLQAGRGEAVRPIAARYATGGPLTRLAGEYLRARLEIEDARFGAAFERLRSSLLEVETFGRLIDADTEALVWLLRLADLLDRRPRAADDLVERFVLAEPPRVLLDQPHYEMPSIALCMRASRPLATRCLTRLRELRESGRTGRVDGAERLLAGAEAVVREDWSEAADQWRPLVRRSPQWLDPVVFERAGETVLLERLERDERHAQPLAGATPLDVSSARRAAAAGDVARASELARRVIDAWSAADTPIPAVGEMRALLASLPQE